MKHKDGATHTAVGEYQKVSEPEKLVYTWSWEDGSMSGSLVTVEFRNLGSATELVLTHECFPTTESRDKHSQGWSGYLGRLEGHLAGSWRGKDQDQGGADYETIAEVHLRVQDRSGSLVTVLLDSEGFDGVIKPVATWTPVKSISFEPRLRAVRQASLQGEVSLQGDVRRVIYGRAV